MRTNIKKLQLPVIFFKEGKQIIAYTPALDLSTFGKTLAQAQRRFGEVVGIFFEELIKMGTLEEVLEECGWEKHHNEFLPPTIISHGMTSVSVPLPN